MKVIDLDKLEVSILEWAIRSKTFTREDLKKDNIISVSLVGRYHDKSCTVWVKGMHFPRSAGQSDEIKFMADTWEDLYYQLTKFFDD